MKETGKSQFPYMKDPNTGKNMLESTDIIQYLFEQYGDGQVRAPCMTAGSWTAELNCQGADPVY